MRMIYIIGAIGWIGNAVFVLMGAQLSVLSSVIACVAAALWLLSIKD